MQRPQPGPCEGGSCAVMTGCAFEQTCITNCVAVSGNSWDVPCVKRRDWILSSVPRTSVQTRSCANGAGGTGGWAVLAGLAAVVASLAPVAGPILEVCAVFQSPPLRSEDHAGTACCVSAAVLELLVTVEQANSPGLIALAASLPAADSKTGIKRAATERHPSRASPHLRPWHRQVCRPPL